MIDLYSDTKTRPSREMLAQIIDAPVGDSQAGEDPSVNALCDDVAQYLGKEAAIFLPSGTMCNQIAVAVHTRPGEELICHHTAHIIHSESGGVSAISGAMTRTIGGDRGQFDAETLASVIRPGSQYSPRTALVVIEQTSNFGGGSIWSLDRINAIADVVKANGSALHMDGARLLNAAVASGVSAAAYAKPFDSVWIDFTKALGAPFGAVLAGTEEFIKATKYRRQMLGGAMRQVGGMAAACSYALIHNVDRLRDDHENARYLAERIGTIPGLKSDGPPETNIVLFTAEGLNPYDVIKACSEEGVRIGFMTAVQKLRAIPHLDTPRAQVEDAVSRIELAMQKLKNQGAR